MLDNFQEEVWSGQFGKDYAERNTFEITELNELYKKKYGISRHEMNQDFIGGLDRSKKILEVGANTGNQLQILQSMGFQNLYGIELNQYAIELGKIRTKNINLIHGSIFDIPFKDNFFDLIFTSGVLIHIDPNNLDAAIKEIYRCSKKLIWGFEYFSEKTKEIKYRGNENLLWKTNFSERYIGSFSDLKLVKEKKYKYTEDDNIDVMFLLIK